MEAKRFKNWWFLAVNGLFFILVGILLLFFTRETILTVINFFGILLLGGGAVLLLTGINNLRKDRSAAMILMEALASIAIGLAILLYPEPTISLFLMLIGIWAIIIGIIQLVIIINIKVIRVNKNVILINALLTIGLGILLLFKPFEWAVFMGKIIGVFSLLLGILPMYFSYMLRSIKYAGPPDKIDDAQDPS